MSLLDKALATSTQFRYRETTPEEEELVWAWMCRRITNKQVLVALGAKDNSTQIIHNLVARVVRDMACSGRLSRTGNNGP